ncbi:hypothetical protein D3C77_625170 [compost metagenome]
MSFGTFCSVIYSPTADKNCSNIDIFLRVYSKLVARPQKGIVNLFASLNTLSDRVHMKPERFHFSINFAYSALYLTGGLIYFVIERLVVVGV